MNGLRETRRSRDERPLVAIAYGAPAEARGRGRESHDDVVLTQSELAPVLIEPLVVLSAHGASFAAATASGSCLASSSNDQTAPSGASRPGPTYTCSTHLPSCVQYIFAGASHSGHSMSDFENPCTSQPPTHGIKFTNRSR